MENGPVRGHSSMLHIFFHHVVVMMFMHGLMVTRGHVVVMMFMHGLMVTRGHVVVHFAFVHALFHIFGPCD